MHARSAYLRSFGISGLLITAALVMLAIVSTIVAFSGWPGGAPASRIDAVAIDEPDGRPVVPATVVAVRPERADAQRAATRARARAVARAPRAPRAAAPDRVALPATNPAPGSGTAPSQPSAQSGPAPTGSPEPAPAEQPAAPAPPATSQPGGTLGAVTGTVDTVADAVTEILAPVAPR